MLKPLLSLRDIGVMPVACSTGPVVIEFIQMMADFALASSYLEAGRFV